VFAELDGLKMIRRKDHKLLCDVTRDFCRLYDLGSDPHERRDVGDRFPKVREELRSVLLSWLRRSPASTPEPVASAPPSEVLLEKAARFEAEAIARLGEVLERGPDGELSPRRLRLRAAELMARLPHPSKTLALKSVLTSDPDTDVRAWAAIGLGLEGQTDVAEALAAAAVGDDDREKRAYRALALQATHSPGAIEEMAAVLPSVDEVTLRCRLIQALGNSRHPRALNALQEAYPVIRSRICVARAFADYQSAAALPFLQARLAEEPYSHVRSSLAEAIARSDGPGAIPILRELFRTETEEIVIAATARLLVQLGVGLPVTRRKAVAVPPDARELWLVPAAEAGASLRVQLRDGAGRGTTRRIETEGGRHAYALMLPDARVRGRPTRAFAPRGYALFR
jgi:HEAT repeat protein